MENKLQHQNEMLYQIIKFIMVGFGNTIIGMTAIFIFYDLCGFGYWLASSLGFGVGSIWSYFLNKYFTFQYKEKNIKIVIKFIINTTICYVVAYAIAKPLTTYLLSHLLSDISQKIVEQIALVIGMGIYIILNFFGQKFVCFKQK